VLERQGLVPPVDDHLEGEEYEQFDDSVRGGLLGGENLRVKLWNSAGEIVYSDATELVGSRYPVTQDLARALSGQPTAEITDLTDDENRLERGLAPQVLEYYVPLHGQQGQVVGAFEVYQDAAHLIGHMAAVRLATWFAIGTGLSVLMLFLFLLFAATARGLRREMAARDRLLRRLVTAQEEERRHVVGDLHDEVGQTLTRILYGVRGSRARLGFQGEVADELERLEHLVDQVIVRVRGLMAAARPVLIEDFGLKAALESFAREQQAESGVPVDVLFSDLPEMDPVTATTLLRAAREAVINARKHAEPRRIKVVVGRRRAWVALEVVDDGIGATVIEDGVGLSYLRDRVDSIGGRVEVSTRPGAGTRVLVLAPLGGSDGGDPPPRG